MRTGTRRTTSPRLPASLSKLAPKSSASESSRRPRGAERRRPVPAADPAFSRPLEDLAPRRRHLRQPEPSTSSPSRPETDRTARRQPRPDSASELPFRRPPPVRTAAAPCSVPKLRLPQRLPPFHLDRHPKARVPVALCSANRQANRLQRPPSVSAPLPLRTRN